MSLTSRMRAAFGRRPVWAMWATSLALVWLYALRSGQDVNWDQRNYHLAVPFLLLHGTFWASVAPVGIQSYLNPLPLFPAYFAITLLPPIVATLAIATAQAAAFVLAGLICLRLVERQPDDGWHLAGLGFVLCLASPITLSEAGTTYPDVTTALPVLLAFLVLLRRDQGGAAWRCCLLAGLLLGLAVGLKLTNLIYVFGVPGFFICGTQSGRARLGGLALTAAATVAAFMVVAGWWHLRVWHEFANPIFPYANNIFRSPDYPATGIVDTRFLPKSGAAVWRYPLYWLLGGSPTPGLASPASEVNPRDARFLPAVLGMAALLACCLVRPALRRRCLASPACGLLVAWSCVYLVWLFVFGIHRYMVGLEILAGAVLLALVLQVPKRARGWVMLALCIAAVVVLHVPNWQRLPFAGHWRTVAAAPFKLPGRPVIFLADAPIAYMALSLPDTARYAGLASEINLSASQNTTLTRQVRLLLGHGEARTPYLMSFDGSTHLHADLLASYGLRLGPDCQKLRLAATMLQLCRLSAVSPETPVSRPPPPQALPAVPARPSETH